jgi:hypothetical protein
MKTSQRYAFAIGIAFFRATASLVGQDPDIEADERRVLEDIYRSSDHEGEIPTSFRDRHDRQTKRVSAPEGAVRVGCICMNGTDSEARSTGACSGRGGVRFWLYRSVEGDTVRIRTGRQERHPQSLDSVELSETNRARAKPARAAVGAVLQPVIQPIIISPYTENQLPAQHYNDGGWFDWSDAATIAGAGISFYLMLRLLLDWVHSHQTLVRYALRHLLRFGKRPAARKSRKTPPKTRL